MTDQDKITTLREALAMCIKVMDSLGMCKNTREFATANAHEALALTADTPEGATDGAADARDGERLLFAMQDIDGFGSVVADKYDFAMQIAYDRGHEEPTKADELDGIRELIDTAMQERAKS